MKTKVSFLFLVLFAFLSFLTSCNSKKIYYVTFLNHDGAVISTQEVEENRSAFAPTLPYRHGYQFVGWSKSYENVTEDIVVRPIYKINPLTKYYVEFKMLKDYDSINAYYGQTLEYHEPQQYPGYRFIGWYYEDKLWDFENDVVKCDMTIIGKYEETDYNIFFNSNGGTYIESLHFSYKDKIDISSIIPKREGYTFVGWEDVPKEMPAHDITLNAIWKANNYNLYLDINNDNNYQIINMECGQKIEITEPIKEGHQFIGWDNDLPTHMPASDLYVKAIWRNIFKEFEVKGSSITKYFGNDKNVDIPEYYYLNNNKIYIHTIASKAFANSSFLETINITPYILEIYSDAFDGCDNLLTNTYDNGIYLPYQDNDFYILLNHINKNYESMTIHDSTHIFAKNALKGLDNLTSLNLTIYSINENRKLDEILEHLFDNYSAYIKCNVRLSDEIYYVGSKQFGNQLYSINISNSVVYFDYDAFVGSSNLSEIYYDGNIENWCNIYFANEYSNPKYYAESIYMYDLNNNYKIVEEIIIPENINVINNYQFVNFNNVTTLNMLNNICKIGFDAFYNCESLNDIYYNGKLNDWLNIDFQGHYSNPMYYCNSFYLLNDENSYIELTELVFDDSITSINEYQFFGLKKLNKIYFSPSVETINSYSFAYCNNLTEVYIPKSVSTVSSNSFYNCKQLIIYMEDYTTYSNNSDIPVYYGINKLNKITQGSYTYILHNDMTATISRYLGQDETIQITSFITYNNKEYKVTKIGDYAFSYNDNLKDVILANSIESIGSYAFSYCQSLNTIKIPNSVYYIENYCFNESTNVNVYSEFSSAPGGWDANWNYVGIYDYSTVTCKVYWNALNVIELDNIIYELNKESLSASIIKYDGTDMIVEIPSKIEHDGNIYNVTSILSKAFYFNSTLRVLFMPSTIIDVKSNAFDYCYNMTIYSNYVEFPSNWPSDWYRNVDHVFYNVNFDNIVYINDMFFSISTNSKEAKLLKYTGNTETLTIPSNIEFNEISYKVTSINGYSFSNVYSLYEIYIPNTVTTIYSYAFTECDKLRKIHIPLSVSTIKQNAFYQCQGLSLYCSSSYQPSGWESFYRYINDVYYNVSNRIIEFNNFIYYLNNDKKTASIISYIGDYKTVTVHGMIRYEGVDYTVTSIEKYAFYDNDTIKSVLLPDNIILKSMVFYNCDNIVIYCKSNSIPNNWASDWNFNYRPVYWGIIGIGVSKYNLITDNNIQYVLDHDNLTAKVTKCLSDNSKIIIPEVVLSDGVSYTVTSFGEEAFMNCSNMTKLIIPESIEFIPEYSLRSCDSLLFNTYKNGLYLGSEEVPNLLLCDYCNMYIDDVVIPNTVKFSSNQQIFDHGNIKNIYYEGTVEEWLNIEFINYYSNPMYFADKVFMLNDNMEYYEIKDLVIPDTVTEIKKFSFYGISLSSITIPNSIKKVNSDAFRSIDSSIDVYYNGTIEEWCKIDFDNDFANPLSFAENFYVLDDLNQYYKVTNLEISNSILSINEYAFSGYNGLISVTIAEGVTEIGSKAFYNCSNLETIILPKSITYIGSYAFGNCLGYIYTKFESIPSDWGYNWAGSCIILTSTENSEIYSNHEYVFKLNNDNLTGTIIKYLNDDNYLDIPGQIPYNNKTYTITEIYSYAFEKCGSLITIKIPNTVKSIMSYAFKSCSSLKSIYIPSSVVSIDSSAFSYCYQLIIYCEGNENDKTLKYSLGYDRKHVYWDVKNDSIYQIDNMQFIIDKTLLNAKLVNYIGNENVLNIPSILNIDNIEYKVIGIEYKALYSCYSLNRIILPETLESIGDYAFGNCKYLISVEMSDNVISIGANAFSSCESLISIKMSKLIRNIGDYAFSSCSKLKGIILPNTIETIGSNTFNGCSNITIICNFRSDEKTWSSDLEWKYTVIYNNGVNEKVVIDSFIFNVNHADLTVELYKYIGTDSIVNIPSNIVINNRKYKVVSIQDKAFYEMKLLEEVIVPESVSYIGYNVFGGCSSLSSIVIPFVGNGTTNHKFGYIFGVDSNYDIPASLHSVTITGRKSENVYYEIKENAFSSSRNIKYFRLLDGITGIESNAFPSSHFVLFMADSVVNIDKYAISTFSNKLIFTTHINIPDGWSNDMINNSYRIHFLENNETVISIDNFIYLLSNESDNGIPQYEASVLGYLGSESSISIPEAIVYNNECYIVSSIYQYAFYRLDIKEVKMSPNIVSINDYAFSSCSNLTDITLSEGLLSIGENAFSSCNNLKYITLPNSLEFINDNAFIYCEKLESIVIPKNVKKVGSSLFYECDNINIFCEIEQQPDSWDNQWNNNNAVYWGVEQGSLIEIDEVRYIIDKDTMKAFIFDTTKTDQFITISDTIEYKKNTYKVYYDCKYIRENKESLKVFILSYDNKYIYDYINNIIVIDENYFYNNMYYEDQFLYEINSDTLKLVKYFGEKNTIIVPSKISINNIINDVSVIGEYAFADCETIKTIFIDNNIMTIEDNAFLNLDKINITLNKDIDIENFSEKWNYCNESLNCLSYSLSDNLPKLHRIDNYSYLIYIDSKTAELYECFDKVINVPKSIQFDGEDYSVTVVNEKALLNCEVIYISNTVKTITLVYNLNVYYSGAVEEFFDINIENIDKLPTFNLYILNGLNKYEVASVFMLSKSNYDNFKYLSNVLDIDIVYINNDIDKLDFDFSSNFVYYNGTIESWCTVELTDISYNPMSNCKYFYYLNDLGDFELLTDLVIPKSVTEIGAYQFANCMSIKTIVLHSGINKIGIDAFSINLDNSSMFKEYRRHLVNTVWFNGLLEDWLKIEFENEYSNPKMVAKKIYFKNVNNKYYEITSLNFSSNIESIGDYQFINFDSIITIEINQNILSIGKYSFCNNDGLIKLVIKPGVTTIREGAFCQCRNLQSVYIPLSINYVEKYAFGTLNSSNAKRLNIYCEAPNINKYWARDWLCGSNSFVYWNIKNEIK